MNRQLLSLISTPLTFAAVAASALEIPSPPADLNGIYSFNARAGEIVAIAREFSPGNPELCRPELLSGERFQFYGNAVQLTPYRESLLIEIETSGRYQYRVVRLEAIALSGSDRDILNSTPEPYIPPRGHSCEIKVRRATDYEKLWAVADRAYEQRDLERALSLYRQVIALAPSYPEPYKRVNSILLDFYTQNIAIADPSNFEEIGQIYLTMPDDLKQPLLDNLEQLARIYERNPSWQRETLDRPEILRAYATFIGTGLASDEIERLLFQP